MRKNLVALAAGVALTAMVIGGCSSQAGGNTTSAAETEATTEAVTTEKETTEAKKPETDVSQAGDEGGKDAKESEGEAYADGPIKVWGTIAEVTEDTILADCESDKGPTGEVVFMIDPDNTYILDGVNGFPVDIKDVETGRFEAYLGPAMTMSLPPQTTPYVVIVNIPEDTEAPQYVVAADQISEKDGGKVLEAIDGSQYILAEDVQITPFLTKNIVQLEDIEKDSRCLVWLNEEKEAERIVLFAE